MQTAHSNIRVLPKVHCIHVVQFDNLGGVIGGCFSYVSVHVSCFSVPQVFAGGD